MAKVKHLVEYESEPEADPQDDLRNHLYALVDFFVTNIVANANGRRLLGLREVLTADELAGRLKVSTPMVGSGAG